MSTGKTAVLFFSRTLNDEFSAKPLGIDKHRFSSIYKFFVNRSLNSAKETGLPVLESYSDQQKGSSFGERLINSLESVKAKGYENVIVIGNDAPELVSKDIHFAEEQLTEGYHVLGKNHRGGAYLIGLKLTDLYVPSLEQIDWNSQFVFEQLSDLLGLISELKAKNDVNSIKDILIILRKSDWLKRSVLAFISGLLTPIFRVKVCLNFHATSLLENQNRRGPPVAILG